MSTDRKQQKTTNLFDELHIEQLINEWFAPLGFKIEQSHIDGLCVVLRKRMDRAKEDYNGHYRP